MLATRVLRAASSASTITSAAAGASSLLRAKATTELTGLAVHPAPVQALSETYNKTLSFLQSLPSESVYRQATQALTESRLAALKKVESFQQDAMNSGDKEKVESVIQQLELEIDAGQIEEVVIQANDELKLAAKMLEWKSHEPLEHPPAPHQWSYFDMAEEAATNE
ncbi:hypothetical protein CBS101457_002026 [Exobasidium rhododendri]|nr:hypothetical protein CBS101457_002026 [Exobasidium rhododendri]